MAINLVLADDHMVVRAGLQSILKSYSDVNVIGEISDLDSLLQFDFSSCDVLLLDLSFQGQNALPLISQLHTKFPELRILILSVYNEDQYAVRAVQSGAVGYLSKEVAADQLILAIRRVAEGERYISDLVEKILIGETPEDEQERIRRILSDREYEVFLLMSQATPTTLIAQKLALNPKTVSTYKKRILAKLDLSSRGDLVKYAIRYGFIDSQNPGISG